jgi:hypothetical protein
LTRSSRVQRQFASLHGLRVSTTRLRTNLQSSTFPIPSPTSSSFNPSDPHSLLSFHPPSTHPLAYDNNTNHHHAPPLSNHHSTLPDGALPPNSPTMASTTAPIPRGTVPRPRPMSLPPQTFSPSHSGTSSDRTRQYNEQPHAAAHRQSQRSVDPTRPRTTNRILGDYTLSKTLGAGSMGKVKLAHHNVSGEKVCKPFILSSYLRFCHLSEPIFLLHTLSLHF